MYFDIVMTSRNRVEYTERTIKSIVERTRTPYKLHVIDDNSSDRTVDYLLSLWKEGVICDLVLRGYRAGATANKNLSYWLTFSDPFVITSDDILCPDVEPDWLSRGVSAILARPQIGQLDLNHPGSSRIRIGRDDLVSFTQYQGGTFGFIRRSVVPYIMLPHFRNNFGQCEDTIRSDMLRANGFALGYLTETFCHHIGVNSEMTKSVYSGVDYGEVDPVTLRPKNEEYVWL